MLATLDSFPERGVKIYPRFSRKACLIARKIGAKISSNEPRNFGLRTFRGSANSMRKMSVSGELGRKEMSSVRLQ